jgi:tetratricopeptide (TPR) repeat protein
MKFYLQQQPRKELKQQRSRPRDSVIDKAHREARECLLKADTAGAIRVYEALLQRQPEKVDAQRSDTLSKLAVLSLIDGSTNRNRKAVKYSSEALNLHRNNARPLHAAVAAMEVGLVHFGSNMPGKALTMWRQAMQMACMAMGYDHPHVAVLLNNIGVLHYESGDWVGSLRALEESVELQKTMLRTATVNVDHALHQLATTMGNLAMTYERRGDSLDQSISLLQETLALYESMETSNDTMEIVSDNLERLLSDDGHADSECAPYETKPELEARDLLVVLPKEQQLLRAKALFSESDNVPDCRKAKPLEASDNHDFLLLGPLDPVLTPEEQVHATALVWFGKSVEPCNETVGHYIASFASSCATEVNLKEVHLQALDHLERGEFDHALDLFRAALRALREKHGDNHHLAGSTLHNIGMIHLLAKQYIQAHSCFVEAVKVRSAALGPDHRDVAASKMKIGLVQLSVGNLEKARKAFREIRESFLRVLGFHHPQFAKIMNNLGVVLYHYRDYAGAVRAFELAYEYQRQHREDGLGGSTIADFGVANSLCNIGFVHAKHGDPVNAVQLFEQALEIRQNHFKDNDPRILQLKSNMIRLGCTRDKSVVWANGDRQSSCVAWADASDETSVCHTTRSMCMADLFGAAFEP